MTYPAGWTPRSPKRSLKEQLVDDLGRDIIAGRLLPGGLLPAEDALLARFSVSRTVLREALNVLSAKGLVDARPKRGTIVRPPSDWSQLDPAIIGWRAEEDVIDPNGEIVLLLDHLTEMRRIIEPAAAQLAARRATEDDLAGLTATYEAMERADSADEYTAADLTFHIACLRAAHNDFLLPVAHAIRSALVLSLRVTNRDPYADRTVSLPLHRAILDAIIARDPEAAARAMLRNLDDADARRARAGYRSGVGHAYAPAKRRRRPASHKRST
jgi:GntR family galactonate operon transcriptional repressor